MKKIILLACIILFSNSSIAQRVIQNPDYVSSNINGRVTKVEITDTETILHFHVNAPIGSWIAIPKETYIEDSSGKGEKIFITKTEGITLTGKNYMILSDEIRYKLFFPRFNTDLARINYGEANKNGNWFIYKLDITKNGSNFLKSNNIQKYSSKNIVVGSPINTIAENRNNIQVFDNLKDDSLLPKDLPTTFFGNWYDKYGSIVLITTPEYIVYNSKIQYYQYIQKTSDTKFKITTAAGTFEILNIENDTLSIRTNKLSTLKRKALNNKVPSALKGDWLHWLKIKKIKITDTHFYNNDGGVLNVYGTIESKIDQVASSSSGNQILFVLYNEGTFSLYIARKIDNEYVLSVKGFPNAKYKKIN